MRAILIDLLFVQHDELLEDFTIPSEIAEKGLCKGTDTDLFFSDNAKDLALAKGICVQCPVIDSCLAYAMSGEEHGVWGGKSARERKLLRGNRPVISIEDRMFAATLRADILSDLDAELVANRYGVDVRTYHRWRNRLRAC